jgi:uncharacterized protein (DUF433 family)
MGRVVCSPGVCGGRPRVDGTRTTVGDLVLALTKYSSPVEEIVSNLGLSDVSDVHAVLRYCAEKRCIEDAPDGYCGPCELSDDHDYDRAALLIDHASGELHFNPNTRGTHIYHGTYEEETESIGPFKIWEMADEFLTKIDN